MNKSIENLSRASENELFCLEHPTHKPDFICLGSNCPYLMLCHECTLNDLNHAKTHMNSLKSCEDLWGILKKTSSSRDNFKEKEIINKIKQTKQNIESIFEESFLFLEKKLEEFLQEFKDNIKERFRLFFLNIVSDEKTLFEKPNEFLKYIKDTSMNIEDQKTFIRSLFERYENSFEINDKNQLLDYLQHKNSDFNEFASIFYKSDSFFESFKKELMLLDSFFSFHDYPKEFTLNTSQNNRSPFTDRVEHYSEPRNNDTIPSFSQKFHKPNSLDGNPLDVFGKVTLIQTIKCGHLKQDKLNEGVIISQVSIIEINGQMKVLTCSKDKTIRIFDSNTFKLDKILEGHRDWVYRFLYFPEKKLLISGSIDRSLRMWDLKPLKPNDYKCFKVLNCESSIISLVKLDEENFAFAMRINGLKIMDLQLNMLAHYRFSKDKEIWSIFPYSKNSSMYIILGLVDGSIGVMKYDKTLKKLSLMEIIKDCHLSLVFEIIEFNFEEKSFLITSSGDGFIKIWEVCFQRENEEIKLNCVKSWKGHEGFIRKILLSKDKILVSCSDDASLKFWQLPDGKLVQTIKKAHGLAIYWLEKFNDDIIITSGEDNLSLVKFWQ